MPASGPTSVSAMARTRRPPNARALPPPLPPETRTVGQLVAEALRLYGRRFWPSLALGVPPAVAGIAVAELPRAAQPVFAVSVGSACVSLSYAGAAALAANARATARIPLAIAAGIVVLIPGQLLLWIFILPGVAWLALVGLVVPVLVIERRGIRESFARAIALARADYVHALGALATLTIAGILTAWVLFFVLRGSGQATLRVASFLSVLVISPLLFLGAALLYFDQEARIRVRERG